jgi:signal peptidase II
MSESSTEVPSTSPSTPPITPAVAGASAAVLDPTSIGSELPSPSASSPSTRPSFIFFGVVAALSLVADVASKAWAEIVLSKRTMLDPSLVLIKDHLTLTLAYNKGGAWGLLQNASEAVRRPFFLAVSLLAIAFIVSLYGRLAPGQRALKWGLPLVLGGALGNLSDRITRSSVIDFIDYRAEWIESMNTFIARGVKAWSVTDHWPTFNVADISICIGVGLMAVDMITSRRRAQQPEPSTAASSAAAAPAPPLSEGPVSSLDSPKAAATDTANDPPRES